MRKTVPFLVLGRDWKSECFQGTCTCERGFGGILCKRNKRINDIVREKEREMLIIDLIDFRLPHLLTKRRSKLNQNK